MTTQAPWEKSRRLIDLTARDDDGELVDLLLDADETRSRDLVAREEEAIIFITIPHSDGDDERTEMVLGDDEGIEIALEHQMTLDQEYRWIPAATKSAATLEDIQWSSIRQMFKQTKSVDETLAWEYAGLRRSRIRRSRLGEKSAVVPRPTAVADTAIDRADLRTALLLLTRGERRSLERSFSGDPLTSGERVQKMRALDKTREVRHPSKDSEPPCKRLELPVHIGTEPVVCADGEKRFMEVSSERS